MASSADREPPRGAERLLRRLVPAHRGDEMIEDLAEEFRDRARVVGRARAWLWYWSQVLHPSMTRLGRELREVRTLRVGSHRATGVAPLSVLGPLRRDLRVATRRLARSPGFTMATVTTLGLGIGATVAIYSVVYGVVLRPLPYPAPDRLVALSHTAQRPIHSKLGQSYGTYVLYRDGASTLDGVAIYQTSSVTITGEGEPERVEVASVTHTFFDLLDVPALRGRTFLASEDEPSGPQVVVISQRLWERRFGADPRVVGRTIEINGLAWEVVGVMPASFQMPAPEIDVWFTQSVDFQQAGFGGFYLSGIGRLAVGVSTETARVELQSIAARIGESYPQAGAFLADAELHAVVTPLHDHILGGVERTLWIVLGGVGLVLIIACANVANLLLVRGEARRRELAVRLALGASRGRLLGDFLAESTWLVALGGLVGLGLSYLGVAVLERLASAYVPRFDQVSVHWPALGVAAGLALASCMVFGALPPLRRGASSASPAVSHSGSRTTADRARTRTRQALVVTQVALALLLLVGASLLTRSYQRLQRIEPGFDAEGVLTFELALPALRYPQRIDAAEFVERLRLRLEASPGVEAAGTIACLPLRPCSWANRNSIARQDAPVDADELPPSAWVNTISPGYFEAMGIPLLSGRPLDASDHRQRTGGVLIDQALAERFWPNEDPVGKRIYPSQTINEEGWYTVVGVVGSVRSQDLTSPADGMVYLPQVGTDDQQWWTTHQTTMAVRTEGDPLALVGLARAALDELDPNLALARVTPMEVVLDRAGARSELAMLLLGLAAVMALFLGLVGVYGVIAYVVDQRRSEIGVRLALGARAFDVGRMVLAQAGKMGVLGVAIGLVVASGTTRLMRVMLFDIAPTDPTTFGGVALFLLLVTLGAAYLPARRAARVDPAETLRSD